MENFHKKRFPNETQEFREAMNRLLAEEIELRRKTEEVAELRRNLPAGGKLKEDYVFEERDIDGNMIKTKLSDLFKPGKDSLIIYNFMFGPNDKTPCVMCNSIMDGINGMIFHAESRINFAVAAKSPVDKINKWAKSRNWNNLRILSSYKNTYNTDYFGENDKGNQLPMLNVFRKTNDGIFHFYGSELLYAPADEGQDGRHVDSIWPLWNLFDLTPEGRGTEWYPKYSY